MAASLYVALLVLFGASVAQAAIAGTFEHGVASGDPQPDGIVLWTRVTPRFLYTGFTPLRKWPYFNVTYTIYSDAATTQPVQEGWFNTTRERDYTVKIFAEGLEPGSEYWYNFRLVNGSELSPTGHFKLPPAAGTPLESLKYFIFSCSNWPTGYFNAYDFASKYDLDFWLHLGDYIYEYSVSDGSSDIRWQPPPQGQQPLGDIETVDDYRQRHATYRTDAGLQSLTAAAPLIAIWDDHEFMNNVWSQGAQNQYPGQVEYWQRRANSLRAYTEWMPIRWNYTDTPQINDLADYAINRTFQFGDLATLFMLEDRVTARTNAGQNTNEFDPTGITSPSTAIREYVIDTEPAEWNATVDEALTQLNEQYNIKRTNKSDVMIGPSQIEWLRQGTDLSVEQGTVWQLYGQGLIMQDWFSPDYEGVLLNRAAPNDEVHAYWEEVFNNLTVTPAAGDPNNTVASYSTSPANLNIYGKHQNVTESVRNTVRAAVALGRWKFNNNFDAWQGYLWDRYYFLSNISNAVNPTVYAGDSHDFWTGYITLVPPEDYVTNSTVVPTSPVVAVEFDGGSVSSNGGNGETAWPLDLENRAWEVANPNMVHVEVRYKGGLYVELTPTNQHVEHIYVNDITSMNYQGWCGIAFDVPARNSTNEEYVINPGQCGPVPTSPPYNSEGITLLKNPLEAAGTPAGILAGTAVPVDPPTVASQSVAP